jgi:ribokinase
MFVGAVGSDSFAERVQRAYRGDGIECRLIEKKGCSSGTAVILVDGRGQNEIVIDSAANAHLSRTDLPLAILRRAKVVVAQLESNLATTAFALKAARAAKVTTVLNPAPMRSDFRLSLLKNVDILIPNETEFVALVRLLPGAGSHTAFDETQLHALSADGLHSLCRRFKVPTVIITLGSKGCFISGRNSCEFVDAFTGVVVKDTTGAGDAFCGGLVAGLSRFGNDIVAAARFGNAVAALAVTKAGAAGAMPSQRQIAAFLRKRKVVIPAPGRSA